MITVWMKTLEEIKDKIQSNPNKQFKLAYFKEPQLSREIVTLLDVSDNTVYYFMKHSSSNSSEVFLQINSWNFPNIEKLLDSIFLTIPILQSLLFLGFDFSNGRLFRTE